jgi:hypothetical protein
MQSLGELGRFFASGFKAKTAEGYLARLQREDFTDDDISEGVERVIATRTARTFPAFAELRGRTTEARTDRTRSEGPRKNNDWPAWLRDKRVGTGNCRCNHGLGMHGPPEGGNGEPTLTGNCRMCECSRYTSP